MRQQAGNGIFSPRETAHPGAGHGRQRGSFWNNLEAVPTFIQQLPLPSSETHPLTLSTGLPTTTWGGSKGNAMPSPLKYLQGWRGEPVITRQGGAQCLPC